MYSRMFILLLCLTVLFSCKDDEPMTKKGSLVLLIKLKYGDRDLVMFEDYNYPSGQKMIFSRFSFFLSQVKLKSASGFKDVLDIDYLNLTNSFTGAANAAKGFSYEIPDIDPGQYTGIKFNVGVPKELNDKTPASFDNDQVLSNQAEYWGDWKSYIFTRTEGQIDLDGDGILEESFALHTGANAAFRTLEFPVSTEITSDGKTMLTMTIDIKKEFGQNPYYDIVNTPQIHSTTQAAQVKTLIDNLTTAISVQ
jgi:hypothetical protein